MLVCVRIVKDNLPLRFRQGTIVINNISEYGHIMGTNLSFELIVRLAARQAGYVQRERYMA